MLNAVLIAAALLPARGITPMPAAPITGQYVQAWDDKTDGKLEPGKRAVMSLTVVEDRVIGKFVGPVAGRVRNATLTGTLIRRGGKTLLTLRQDEPGYTVLYQAAWDKAGVFKGTWLDTRGGSGDTVIGYDARISR